MSRQSPGPSGRPTFWDNFQHVVRSLFTVKAFSTFGLLNSLYTRLSVMAFVGRYWRKSTMFFIVVSGGIGIAGAVAEVVSDRGSVLAWIGVGSALFTIVYKLVVLHKPMAFGGEFEEMTFDKTVLLDDQEPIEDGNPPYFHRFRSCPPHAHLIRISPYSGVQDSATYIEFDEAISRHLLTGQIACSKAGKGGYVHPGVQDVLDARADMRDLQVQVLDLRSRDALRAGTSLFDASKIGLERIDLEDGSLTCRLRKTSYFCSVVTNDAAAWMIKHDSDASRRAALFDLYPARCEIDRGTGEKVFYLKPISETRGLSNHIGMVVVAVSADGVPVLCQQGRHTEQNAERAVLSGAGSLDYDDFRLSGADKTGQLDDAIRYGMARELLEETGGVPQDSHRAFDHERLRAYATRIRVAGVYRDLKRGALPIFVGFCRMQETFDEIRDRRASTVWGLSAPIETRVLKDLPQTSVANAKAFKTYLEEHLHPRNRRTPSDQLMVIRKLLTYDVMKQHMNEALSLPESGPVETGSRPGVRAGPS